MIYNGQTGSATSGPAGQRRACHGMRIASVEGHGRASCAKDFFMLRQIPSHLFLLLLACSCASSPTKTPAVPKTSVAAPAPDPAPEPPAPPPSVSKPKLGPGQCADGFDCVDTVGFPPPGHRWDCVDGKCGRVKLPGSAPEQTGITQPTAQEEGKVEAKKSKKRHR
jgi:hypothetical protein